MDPSRVDNSGLGLDPSHNSLGWWDQVIIEYSSESWHNYNWKKGAQGIISQNISCRRKGKCL